MMKTDRNLDILRATAVMVVLVAHCLPASPAQQAAGHYAVLIFFVHTALVLLLSLGRQAGARGMTARFYTQRVFRIYPLSVLCVLVTLAFRISWPDSVFTPRSGLSIAINIPLVQNFVHERFSISPPLWSLPYEVQMYAVLPVVFWFLRKRGKRAAWGLAAASLALLIAEMLVNPFRGLSITRYFPCFRGGALAYSAYGSQRRLSWLLWPVAIAGLGVLYWLTGQTMPGDWFACIALGLLVAVFREAPTGLLSKAAGVLARYSYGIYLSHVPLLWLCFQRLMFLPPAAKWALFAVSMCTVPVALYHAIEEPMIAAGKGLSMRMFPIGERAAPPTAAPATLA
jgi:peptidoglycan/LPS O-acetylase OafA/YrhL